MPTTQVPPYSGYEGSNREQPTPVPLVQLLHQAPTPILITAQAEHRITFTNPLMVETLRRSSTENLLGKPIRDALPELDGQGFFELLDQAFETGVVYSGTEFPLNFNGEAPLSDDPTYLSFVLQPLRDINGHVEGMMVQATEVTSIVISRREKEYLEHRVQQQWTELEAIYKAAPIGLALYDPEQFRLLRLNDKLAEILGVPAGDVLGKSIVDIAHHIPDLPDLFKKIAEKGSAESQVIGQELPEQPGVHRHWILNHTPLFWADGKLRAISTVSLDITAQKQAETALAEAERLAATERHRLEIERQRFVALADNSKDFISMCDTEGRPFFANKAALKLVGLESLDDFNRMPIREFFFPEDQERVIGEFLPGAWSEGFGETEIRFRHFKTNEAIWMCYQVFVVRGRTGDALGMATVSRDLTDEKRGEAALVRSEKLAAVGRLATSIAHEINNPLAAVTNLLYLALGHDNTADVQDLLKQAERELRRVSKVANQTLRFHKQASRPQLISTESLFESVLVVYEGRLRNSNIQVEARRYAEEPVECFEGDIRQVLSNVLGNAIDAMPHGGRMLLRSRKGTEWSSGPLWPHSHHCGQWMRHEPRGTGQIVRSVFYNQGDWRHWTRSVDQRRDHGAPSGTHPLAKLPGSRSSRHSSNPVFARCAARASRHQLKRVERPRAWRSLAREVSGRGRARLAGRAGRRGQGRRWTDLLSGARGAWRGRQCPYLLG